jgi:hypothetical protein
VPCRTFSLGLGGKQEGGSRKCVSGLHCIFRCSGCQSKFTEWRAYGLSTISFRSGGVSVKSSVVNIRGEKDRPLNSIPLQNAVLCADCDVVSDSPHDHCLVCGSRSLINMSRLLGGMLPRERAMLIDTSGGPCILPRPVLKFPRTPRVLNSRGRAKEKRDPVQSRLSK